MYNCLQCSDSIYIRELLMKQSQWLLLYYLIIGNEPGFVMLALASSMISAEVLY